jgi:hypothetical protein
MRCDAGCTTDLPPGRVRAEGEGEMKKRCRSTPAAMVTLVLYSMSAWAQTPKELKTKSGSSVVLVDFVSARTDCSSIPGPITVPVVREKPTNGIVQMVIVVADVAPRVNVRPERSQPPH